MADDREVFKVRRDAGLAKRHETREARAVRKATAEEIALALEERDGVDWALAGQHAGADAARIAREIGSRDPE